MSRFAVLVALLLGSIFSPMPAEAQVSPLPTDAVSGTTERFGSPDGVETCEVTLSTSDRASGTTVAAGGSAVYTFVDSSGATVIDVRATVIEADGLVAITNEQASASIGLVEGPGSMRIRWEFLDPTTGDPIEFEPRVTVADLGRDGTESLVLPRRLINGTTAIVGREPRIQEGPDAVYFFSNADLTNTDFSVDLAWTSNFEAVFETHATGPSGLRYRFGCAPVTRLAMIGDDSSAASGGPGGSTTLPWILAGAAIVIGAIGTGWALRSKKVIDHEVIDTLTGAFNMSMIDRHLRGLVLNEQRAGFAVLKIDVDRFREVNRTRGRPVGDAVLRAIADRAQQQLRSPHDAVVRLGGDEFLVLLTDLTEPRAEGAAMATALLASVSEPIELPPPPLDPDADPDDGPLEPQSIVASISIGVAHCDRPTDLMALANDADDVLYVAKDHGMGQLRVHPAPTRSLEAAGDPGWQQLPSLRNYGKGEPPPGTEPEFVKKPG